MYVCYVVFSLIIFIINDPGCLATGTTLAAAADSQQQQQQQQHHHLHLHHQHQQQLHQQQQLGDGGGGGGFTTEDRRPPNQQQQTLAEDTQQVFLRASDGHYHFAHAQYQWKQETTQGGSEVREFYGYSNFESVTMPVNKNEQQQQQQKLHQDQLAYYQYTSHLEQHQYHQVQKNQHTTHLQERHQQNNHHHQHPLHQPQPQQQPQYHNQEHHEDNIYLPHNHLQQYQQHVIIQKHVSFGEGPEVADLVHAVVYDHNFNPPNHHHLYQQHERDSCDSRRMEESMYSVREPPSTCSATKPINQAANPDSHHQAAQNNVVPNLSHGGQPPSNRNSNIDSFPLTSHLHKYDSSLMSAIRHYWREVSALCLGSAIFLNWLFVIIKRKFVASGLTRAEHAIESIHQPTTRSISKDTNNSSAHDSAFEETASPSSLLDDVDLSSHSASSAGGGKPQEKTTPSVPISETITSTIRQRSSTLKAEPIPIPVPSGHKSLSNSLSNSLNTSEYISRYSSDFDSIQRLGRGGFGIVFEARNKIDDCHYAVKRICLPLEKEARERVMREVRALAKLDHAGIVRYYNAWLETPPDEWLKQHDAQLGVVNSIDGTSFPSTDGIYDRNESSIRRPGGKALGDSGDNSSGLFGTNPFQGRRMGKAARKFLINNSSSPSLDIVFEGSGSIRLESENSTEKTGSSNSTKKNDEDDKPGERNNFSELSENDNEGDINSDSDDSDFIQFQSSGNRNRTDDNSDDEFSISVSRLTEPFSSSSSSGDSGDNRVEDGGRKIKNGEQQASTRRRRSIQKPVDRDERKKALNYQKEMRQLNNASLVDNLHVEKVYLYIQMQLCRKDTLKDWLKTNCENRDKTNIFDLFYQIVDAVEYVHSQDLIHRDLKPSNIFFSLDGTLKIGDFGLCRAKTSAGIGSSLDLQEYVGESDAERSFEAVHTEQVGTQLYMSPEQLNGLSYNQKVDIFAMGLILLELLIPFKTQMQRVNVLFKARNNLYSDEFRQDHPQEYELVRALLNRSPQKRPTATEIKQHELLASAQLSQPVIERIYHRRRTISSNSSTE